MSQTLESSALQEPQSVEEALRLQNARLAAFQEIVLGLTSTLELRDVLQRVAEMAQTLAASAHAHIYLYDPLRDELNLAASHWAPDQRAVPLQPRQAGITYWVARNGKPEFIEDTTDHPAYTGVPADARPKALVCLPLVKGSRVLGTLNLGYWQTHHFDSETRSFLDLMAKHATIAIENARLYTAAQSRARELAALHKVGLDISGHLDLKELLENVVRRISELLDAGGGHVCLFDSERNVLELFAAYGMEQNYAGTIIQLGEGIAGRVALTRQPLTVADYHNWEGRAMAFESEPLGALAAVPLLWQDQVLGTLGIHMPADSPRTFSLDDIRLMEQLAAQTAIAIQNARLYQSATRSAAELRRLYDTSLDITSQLEISKLLALVIQRAAELLRGDSGNFYFYDDNTDELVPSAPFGQHTVEHMIRLKPGEGATGRVFLSGEPLIVQDYDAWKGRGPRIPFGRYGRILHVPVKRGNQVIGVMSVNRPMSAPAYTEEDMRLLSLFANQAAIAIENARLYQVGVEKARMEHELQVARTLQSSLIPRETLQVTGWEFATLWQPAREVSGDFYDLVPILPEEGSRSTSLVGLMIADVSDKGMPAALFMALARSTVRASIAFAQSPAECITRANRLISTDAASGMFVTLCYAQLDPTTGEMVYVNAGHNPPLLYCKREDRLSEFARTGMVLGVDDKCTFTQQVVKLDPGDFILFYTDGVTDACNAEQQEFGKERLRQIALERPHASAVEMVAALEQALGEFVADTPPSDDIAVMCVKRLQVQSGKS